MRGDTQFFIPFTDNFSRPKSSLAHLREFFRTSLRTNAENRVKLLQSRDTGKSWNEWSMLSPERRNLSRDWWAKFESSFGIGKQNRKFENLESEIISSISFGSRREKWEIAETHVLDKESESFFVVQCCEVVERIVKRDTRFIIGRRENQLLNFIHIIIFISIYIIFDSYVISRRRK